jgi:hypothetical protein
LVSDVKGRDLRGVKQRENGENIKMWNFIDLSSSPNNIRQIKSRRIRWGGGCGTYGRGEKSVQGFGGKARRKKTTWKTKT